jgi:hypothetical protein
MALRRDDLTNLHRLIDVVESSHARLAARGADTTHAAELLAKLRQTRAALSVWLGEAAAPTPHGRTPSI